MGTITMVMPDEDRWFFNELGVGARARSVQAGHSVTVCRVPVGGAAGMEAAECIERAFAAEDSLGAVAAGFPYRGNGGDRFLSWKRPLVIVAGSVLGFPVVSFDDVGIGRTMTKHLLDLGHQRVAHLTGTLAPDRAFVYMRRRARGYRMTMESAGLVSQVVETTLGGNELDAVIESLLTSPGRPTAIFAVYDKVAFRVMDVAHQLGLQVGRDLSVAGVNDHPDARQAELTTARHRPAEVGAMAVAVAVAVAVEMILDGLQPGLGAREIAPPDQHLHPPHQHWPPPRRLTLAGLEASTGSPAPNCAWYRRCDVVLGAASVRARPDPRFGSTAQD